MMETREEFIALAQEAHGSRYGYGRVDFVDERTGVMIYCSTHGTFTMTPDDHAYKGYRCPQCVEVQVDDIRLERAFIKLREAYFEAYRTFNGDLAYEISQAKDIEELMELLIENNHYEHLDMSVEVFQVMVKRVL